MNRRCTGDSCLAAAGARSVSLDMPIATVLMNPRQEWSRLASGCGRMRVARNLEVDWNKFSADKYLFTHCFIAGTEVLMGDGTLKNIEDVNEGDLVVSHTGITRRVSKKMSRSYNGDVCVLSVTGLPNDVCVTPEHPFWVKKQNKVCGCGCGKDISNWRDGSNFILGHQNRIFKYGDKKTIAAKEYKRAMDVLEWKKAGELEGGDRVAHGDFSEGWIEESYAFAQLLGYYLSEGWVNKEFNRKCEKYGEVVGVSFAFNSSEEHTYVKDVVDLIYELTGKDANIEDRRPKSNCIVVGVRDEFLAKKLLEFGGMGADGKRLHPDVFRWKNDLQRLVFSRWFRGDAGVTISKNLAWGLKFLANNCKIPTNLIERPKKMRSHASFLLQLRPGFMKDNAEEFGCLSGKILAKGDNRVKRDIVDGKMTSAISHIERKHFSGVVHNLSVEVDESYVAGGLVVHNCTIVASVETEDNGYLIKPACNELVNNNGNAWTNEVLLATFRTFVGGENYLEHVQVPELSKGKLLDAVLRPLTYTDKEGRTANIFYTDILVATDRKHDKLVRKIASGDLTTMSMGCLADWVTCSKCGRVMGDNTPNCKHLDHELLAKFWDKKGVERVVAELCGRTIVDKDGKRVGDPKSVKFIEASWVERPAFYGAVLNHYVSELPKSASNILEFPTEKLHLAMEDIFKLRVADKSGMLVLRVAQAEIARRMREDRLWKIAGRLV